MVGMQLPDGRVRLIASKTLSLAELEMRADYEVFSSWYEPHGRPIRTSQVYTLHADMLNFTLIEADDYPSAFEGLFRTWNPAPERREITTQLEIEG